MSEVESTKVSWRVYLLNGEELIIQEDVDWVGLWNSMGDPVKAWIRIDDSLLLNPAHIVRVERF